MITPLQPKSVFLNIPYDERFQDLYLAYIVGLSHLDLQPRATLGIAGGERRLDRIFQLIQSCPYSVHDLSRVELDRNPPVTPRFNMPFELGIATAWQKLHPKRHTWFVFESQQRRLQKSLSDLDGTDVNLHGGTVEGVMRELCNAFVKPGAPSVPAMLRNYKRLQRQLPSILDNAGSDNLFHARVFSDLCFAATTIARDIEETE